MRDGSGSAGPSDHGHSGQSALVVPKHPPRVARHRHQPASDVPVKIYEQVVAFSPQTGGQTRQSHRGIEAFHLAYAGERPGKGAVLLAREKVHLCIRKDAAQLPGDRRRQHDIAHRAEPDDQYAGWRVGEGHCFVHQEKVIASRTKDTGSYAGACTGSPAQHPDGLPRCSYARACTGRPACYPGGLPSCSPTASPTMSTEMPESSQRGPRSQVEH